VGILGIHPARKYQNEGGPDITKMMELMNRSSQPVEDRTRIMEAVAFNYLILGTDAHAKNYSLLLGRNQQVRLARLYDVASFLPYVDRHKDCRFAMKIGGYDKDNQIQPRHFDKLARTCEFPAQSMRQIVIEMAEGIPDAADRVIRAMSDKGVSHQEVDNLVESLKKRAAEKSKEFSAS
jgi:serine/threonine-protein kinase HipA